MSFFERLREAAATARFIAWELALLAGHRLRKINRPLLLFLGFCLTSLLIMQIAVTLFQQQPDKWRSEPPTEEQLKYAGDLGIDRPGQFTRGALAELITKAKEIRRDED